MGLSLEVFESAESSSHTAIKCAFFCVVCPLNLPVASPSIASLDAGLYFHFGCHMEPREGTQQRDDIAELSAFLLYSLRIVLWQPIPGRELLSSFYL